MMGVYFSGWRMCDCLVMRMGVFFLFFCFGHSALELVSIRLFSFLKRFFIGGDRHNYRIQFINSRVRPNLLLRECFYTLWSTLLFLSLKHAFPDVEKQKLLLQESPSIIKDNQNSHPHAPQPLLQPPPLLTTSPIPFHLTKSFHLPLLLKYVSISSIISIQQPTSLIQLLPT